MKQETKRRIEISNLHEFADSLILIKDSLLLPKSSIEFQVSAPHITAEMAIRTMVLA